MTPMLPAGGDARQGAPLLGSRALHRRAGRQHSREQRNASALDTSNDSYARWAPRGCASPLALGTMTSDDGPGDRSQSG